MACASSLLGRVRAAEPEVLRDRHREQRRVLERGRDGLAQRGQRQFADVVSVDPDRTLGDVVEPRQQAGQHRLTGARRADEGERLPRLDGDVDVPQRPVVGIGEPEAHVDEFEQAAARRLRHWAVLDLEWRVEDLGDPVRRGERLLRHRQQKPKRCDRPDQRQHHRDERDQRAHRHVVVARRVGAEAQHDDQRQVRDDLQQRPELRRNRHPARPACRRGR